MYKIFRTRIKKVYVSLVSAFALKVFAPKNQHATKPEKSFRTLQDFKSTGKLASYSQVKKTVVGFFYLQEWFNTKTFFLCPGILVSHAQGSGHSGLATGNFWFFVQQKIK